jgi:hypothetical protein
MGKEKKKEPEALKEKALPPKEKKSTVHPKNHISSSNQVT